MGINVVTTGFTAPLVYTMLERDPYKEEVRDAAAWALPHLAGLY